MTAVTPGDETSQRPRDRPCSEGIGADRGTTYIELLMSIVLIGTAVIAILTAVRATTIATRIDREQTHAISALLAAAGELHQSAPAPCPGNPVTFYDVAITDPVSLPHEGGPADTIVVMAVGYAGRTDPADPLTYGPGSCSSSVLVSHRITLEYRHLGLPVETLEVVKRD